MVCSFRIVVVIVGNGLAARGLCPRARTKRSFNSLVIIFSFRCFCCLLLLFVRLLLCFRLSACRPFIRFTGNRYKYYYSFSCISIRTPRIVSSCIHHFLHLSQRKNFGVADWVRDAFVFICKHYVGPNAIVPRQSNEREKNGGHFRRVFNILRCEACVKWDRPLKRAIIWRGYLCMMRSSTRRGEETGEILQACGNCHAYSLALHHDWLRTGPAGERKFRRVAICRIRSRCITQF